MNLAKQESPLTSIIKLAKHYNVSLDYICGVSNVKNEYPVGTRIQLEEMIDIYSPVKSGTRGTVRFVDSIGQIHMQWDDGRSLALIPETDSFRKLTEDEIAEEVRMEQSSMDEPKM